jgi:hypothetical protein
MYRICVALKNEAERLGLCTDPRDIAALQPKHVSAAQVERTKLQIAQLHKTRLSEMRARLVKHREERKLE